MSATRRRALLAAMTTPLLSAAPSAWRPLFNGKNLDGWEKIGDGVWSIMSDGTLLGDRTPKQSHDQAWVYTREEFGAFDLELDFWTRLGGNSGISLRDNTRAKYAVYPNHDRERTPSHNGYEIQISNGYADDPYPTGSVYLFAKARTGFQKAGDWNRLRLESRNEMIRTYLNGEKVCEHPGDPARPKKGPIGLQLHDPNSVVMFKNVRIRTL
ncbi:MAG: DUF1080 domain-containing protein [Bryobacterales bacterium]|nr:DUF1080 domain-containing protein [Bryobacterales bacterium]